MGILIPLRSDDDEEENNRNEQYLIETGAIAAKWGGFRVWARHSKCCCIQYDIFKWGFIHDQGYGLGVVFSCNDSS